VKVASTSEYDAGVTAHQAIPRALEEKSRPVVVAFPGAAL
jgi:hypothetical protein